MLISVNDTYRAKNCLLISKKFPICSKDSDQKCVLLCFWAYPIISVRWMRLRHLVLVCSKHGWQIIAQNFPPFTIFNFLPFHSMDWIRNKKMKMYNILEAVNHWRRHRIYQSRCVVEIRETSLKLMSPQLKIGCSFLFHSVCLLWNCCNFSRGFLVFAKRK